MKKSEDTTIFLDSSLVLNLIKDLDLNAFVEAAFAGESPTAVSLAKVVTPIQTDDYRMAWINVMPSYLREEGLFGIKGVGVCPTNFRDRGLPNTVGFIVIMDAVSAYPRFILDGTVISYLRTAALACVGATYGATKDASNVAIAGNGLMAYSILLSLNKAFPIRDLTVLPSSEASGKEFIARVARKLPNCNVRLTSSLLREVDPYQMIFLTTNDRRQLFSHTNARKGQFICSLSGFREFSVDAIQLSDFLVFDRKAAAIKRMMEENARFEPLTDYLECLKSNDEKILDLGECLRQGRNIRASDDDIITYIPSGIASLDLAIASAICKKALETEQGMVLSKAFSTDIDSLDAVL